MYLVAKLILEKYFCTVKYWHLLLWGLHLNNQKCIESQLKLSLGFFKIYKRTEHLLQTLIFEPLFIRSLMAKTFVIVNLEYYISNKP